MNRIKLKQALATITLMAFHNVTPSQCFSSDLTYESQRTETRRYFRSLNDENPMLKSHDVSSFLGNTFSDSTTGANNLSNMPTWLKLPRSHLVEENIQALESLMAESYFTSTEINRLIDALQLASKGDGNKLAGAAEFCMILMETMEMGLNALIAASFHYCSCVTARELSIRSPSGTATSQFGAWDFRPDPNVESFGKHVLQIERDAAHLKRLEIVASTVIKNSGNSQRASPDPQDAQNLSGLLLTETKDWRALAIRSAACLYRLRGILNSGTAHVLTPEYVRISKEALYIFAPLASRLGMHRLKNELEGAAFRLLYRRQYETVMSLSHYTRDSEPVRRGAFGRYRPTNVQHRKSPEIEIGESMNKILSEVKAEMTEMLSTDPEFVTNVESFSVTARVKEAYSTWKKMLRNGSDHILEVPDAIALRIILKAKKGSPTEDISVTQARERALCYYAQKLCIDRWAPVEGNPRFKDYISNPKPNGYQSLHYTASTEWLGKDWSMEIQVRSEEMHKVAEFGLASHWDYKARSKNKKSKDSTATAAGEQSVEINEHFGKNTIQSSDAYIRSLQEWHWKQHSGVLDARASSDETFILSDEAESKIRADRIRARTQMLTPYIEALVEAKSDLVRENVFIFLSQPEDTESTDGQVLALPAGAVVLDALRHCTRDLEFDYPRYMEEFISHNGARAILTTRLQNGDILSIPSVTPSVTAS